MLAYIFALKGNTVSTKTIHSAIGFLWLINSILEEGSIDKKGSNLVTLTLQNVESSLTVKCTACIHTVHTIMDQQLFAINVLQWVILLLTFSKPGVSLCYEPLWIQISNPQCLWRQRLLQYVQCTLYGAVSENDFFESSLKLCHLLFMYSKQSIVCYNYSI